MCASLIWLWLSHCCFHTKRVICKHCKSIIYIKHGTNQYGRLSATLTALCAATVSLSVLNFSVSTWVPEDTSALSFGLEKIKIEIWAPLKPGAMPHSGPCEGYVSGSREDKNNQGQHWFICGLVWLQWMQERIWKRNLSVHNQISRPTCARYTLWTFYYFLLKLSSCVEF